MLSYRTGKPHYSFLEPNNTQSTLGTESSLSFSSLQGNWLGYSYNIQTFPFFFLFFNLAPAGWKAIEKKRHILKSYLSSSFLFFPFSTCFFIENLTFHTFFPVNGSIAKKMHPQANLPMSSCWTQPTSKVTFLEELCHSSSFFWQLQLCPYPLSFKRDSKTLCSITDITSEVTYSRKPLRTPGQKQRPRDKDRGEVRQTPEQKINLE